MSNPPWPAVPSGDLRFETPDGVGHVRGDTVSVNLYDPAQPKCQIPGDYYKTHEVPDPYKKR